MNNFNLTVAIYLILLAILIGIAWIIYHLYTSRSNQTNYAVEEENVTPLSTNTKYANSTLSEEMKSGYMAKVVVYMERDKAYLISHLTLGKMAESLEIPKHHLSQVINEKMGCGFLELLNIYRVKEVEKILQKEKGNDRPLMDIGREVGFNSKSTFYAAFKKQTNKSPGKYRKDLMKKITEYQSLFKQSKMKRSAILLMILSNGYLLINQTY